MDKEKIGIIIQARLGSTRFPKKILYNLFNKITVLEFIINNLKTLNIPIVVATSTNKIDDELEKFLIDKKINVFRGDEDNVLKRFVDCARKYKFNRIIRVCSDNPFIQPDLISKLIAQKKCDYISYKILGKEAMLTHYGFFSEIVSLDALQKELKIIKNEEEKQHVTYFIYKNPNLFDVKFININEDFFKRNFRFTIDTFEDLSLIKKILQETNGKYDLNTLSNIINNNPQIESEMETQIKKNKKY